MEKMNKRKMEAADMEAVVGGAFIIIPPFELEAAKEAVDSIGKTFRNELLTGRGKC